MRFFYDNGIMAIDFPIEMRCSKCSSKLEIEICESDNETFFSIKPCEKCLNDVTMEMAEDL